MDISRCLLVTETVVMHSLKLVQTARVGAACNEWHEVVRVSWRIPTYSVLV